MKKIFLYSIAVLFFTSCLKTELQEPVELDSQLELSNEYKLNFELEMIDYLSPNNGDKYDIEMNQDIDYNYRVIDLKDEPRYIWFLYNMPTISEDSLMVLFSIRFEMEDDLGLPLAELDLEYLYAEAKSNLVPLADGSYVYPNKSLLADHLQNYVWDNPEKLWTDKTQMMVTAPHGIIANTDFAIFKYSSNGFYYEQENLEMTGVQYDFTNDKIYLNGRFDVTIKDLSCGWYPYYNLNKSNFTAVIN